MCLTEGRLYVIPTTQLNLVDLYFEKGDIPKSKIHLDLAMKSIQELDYSPKLADANHAYARLLLEEGNLDAAEMFAKEGKSLAGKYNLKGMMAICTLIQGLISGARGEKKVAKREIKYAINALRKLSLNYEVARALHRQARYLSSIGEEEEAVEALEEAKQLFEQMNLDYEVKKIEKEKF
jgi:tetratricopeptide (TPR) repeat protein